LTLRKQIEHSYVPRKNCSIFASLKLKFFRESSRTETLATSDTVKDELACEEVTSIRDPSSV
uniref:Ovule protein n=1 Tax=Rodentolepis nana TaxID=102285 RepID=A0A0R3TE56_RODNA